MEKFNLYSDVCAKVDEIFAAEGVYDVAGLEGLNSNIIGRMFVSIVDSVGQLFKTFATNLTRVNKALKRSELNEFVMSNSLKVRTVDKIPYEKLVDVDIDIPANMKGTYKEAVNTLIAVYTKLNALNNGKLVSTSFIEALNSINTGDSRFSKQVESTAIIVTRLINASKQAIDTCMDQFEGKFAYKAKYTDMFLSSQEWVEVRKTLIENEYRLQDVHELTDLIGKMEGTLKQIAQAADQNDTKITPRDLKNMAETAKNIALVFDSYGMATTRQMAIEHNYVLNINHIYTTVK